VRHCLPRDRFTDNPFLERRKPRLERLFLLRRCRCRWRCSRPCVSTITIVITRLRSGTQNGRHAERRAQHAAPRRDCAAGHGPYARCSQTTTTTMPLLLLLLLLQLLLLVVIPLAAITSPCLVSRSVAAMSYAAAHRRPSVFARRGEAASQRWHRCQHCCCCCCCCCCCWQCALLSMGASHRRLTHVVVCSRSSVRYLT